MAIVELVSYSSGQDFSIASVGYLTLDTGSPLSLGFNVTATDVDGDQSNGTIAITTSPLTSNVNETGFGQLVGWEIVARPSMGWAATTPIS